MSLRRSRIRLIPALLLLAVLAAPADAQRADRPLPALGELRAGWNTLAPGGETACAQGTDFSFYVRPGDPARVLFYLYGGGACWSAETCDPDRQDTYTDAVDPSISPERLGGIFMLDHPDNPFAGYSMVAVPVCTGDVHLGARDVTYTLSSGDGASRSFTIRHRGYTNAMAALQWVQEQFASPRQIVVAGTSAGAVAAPFYASLLAQRHPAIRVVSLADDAGSYASSAVAGVDAAQWGFPGTMQRHRGWESVGGSFGIEHVYITAARSAPNLRLYQIDHANDAVQRFFLELAGIEDPDVLRLIRDNRRRIADEVPTFRSFTVGGFSHTVLPNDLFYLYQTQGMPVREWTAAAVAGRDVSSVDCGSCILPGLRFSERDLRIVERMLELLSPPEARLREGVRGVLTMLTEVGEWIRAGLRDAGVQ